MKRAAAWLLLAALLGQAQAEETPPAATSIAVPAPATALVPLRHGYAFEQADILIRQRLFGLAHGLSLLAAACLDLPEHSATIQEAYAAWHARQARTIEILVIDLSRHYFAGRADEASWPDLVRALQLTENIEPALGEVSLAEACASLPEAIARPRYELEKLLADSTAPALQLAPAIATAPAPTAKGVPAAERAAE